MSDFSSDFLGLYHQIFSSFVRFYIFSVYRRPDPAGTIHPPHRSPAIHQQHHPIITCIIGIFISAPPTRHNIFLWSPFSRSPPFFSFSFYNFPFIFHDLWPPVICSSISCLLVSTASHLCFISPFKYSHFLLLCKMSCVPNFNCTTTILCCPTSELETKPPSVKC